MVHSSNSTSNVKNEAARRPISSFSMAHALSMVRRRKEEQNKEEKSEEESKRERARAKRMRRRANQKLARRKAKKQNDEGSTVDESTEPIDAKKKDEPELDLRKNLKRVASDESTQDSSSATAPPPPKKKKKRKSKTSKVKADNSTVQSFDDEALNAQLMKLKSLIPRALMLKKGPTDS